MAGPKEQVVSLVDADPEKDRSRMSAMCHPHPLPSQLTTAKRYFQACLSCRDCDAVLEMNEAPGPGVLEAQESDEGKATE